MSKREAPSVPGRGARWYDRLGAWVEARYGLLTWLLVGGYVLLAVLNLDAKVSLGGDDSWYVLAADDFWHGLAFPQWHGAFYSILISGLVGGIGLSVPWLKLLSLLMSATALYVLGIALRRRVPPVVWLCGMLLSAVCHRWVVYGTTTYSEPLFMLLQSLLVWRFLVLLDAEHSPRGLRWPSIRPYLVLGGLTFLLALTRNVGWAAAVAIVLFFLVVLRNWRGALLYLGGLAVFQLPFSLYKYMVWGNRGVAFGGQLSRAFQVNFYDLSEGYEDFFGLVSRVLNNAYQYLSYWMLRFAGFSSSGSWLVTVLLVALIAWIVIWSWRRDRGLCFVGGYLGVALGVTFLLQQVMWNQERLVVIYFPLLIFLLFGGFVQMLRARWRGAVILVLVLVTGGGVISNLVYNLREVTPERLVANLRGDEFYGLTPDWDSYLRCAKWVGENIPDTAVVACRKPNNARIYARRPFHGIFRVPAQTPLGAQDYIDSVGIDYVMVGRLRQKESKRTENYLNAMHVFLSMSMHLWPDRFELVHSEGQSEPTYLFRVRHDRARGTESEYRRRLEAGLLIDPDQIEVLYQLSRLSLDQREPEEAMRYAGRAIQLFHQHEEFPPYALLEVLAMSHFVRGEFQKSIQIFESCTKHFPELPEAWYNLGVCYARVGDPRAAEYKARAQRMKEVAP